MFICTAQSDLPLFVQCFNMQTTLVNQAGINTIIHHQTVRDGYLIYVEALGLSLVARKLRIDWPSGS